ncbi:OmpP1/FadL family transporter [Thalassotalea montiporae]
MQYKKLSIIISSLLLSSSFSQITQAAGFKIYEQSTSSMGNAYAGRGAVVEDASILYSNPAGLTKLPGASLSIGGGYIFGQSEYSNVSATNVLGQPVSGETSGDFDISEVVPYAFYASPINDEWAWGVGLYAPAAISSTYDENFIGRNFAQDTELTIISLQPTLAYQVSEQFSVGLGISVSYAEGRLTAFKDIGGLCENADFINAAYAPLGLGDVHNSNYCDIQYELDSSDWAVSATLGALWQPSRETSIAFVYNSAIDLTLANDFEITNVPIVGAAAGGRDDLFVVAPELPAVDLNTGLLGSSPLEKEAAQMDLTLPQNFSISVNQVLSPEISLQASLQWMDWSEFDNISIISEQETGPISQVTEADLNEEGYIAYIPEKWEDTFALALGVTYQWSPKIKLKTGVAYDTSPIPQERRTARIPTDDRIWWTIGGNWQLNSDWTLDLAYGYMWMKDTSINEFEYNVQDQRITNANLTADYDTNVHLLSVQLNYWL